jgi:hypothetical protein
MYPVTNKTHGGDGQRQKIGIGKNMNPKQFIRYTRKLDRKGYAICDGTTENINLLDLLHTVIIVGGVFGLSGLIVYKIKNIIKRKQ